MFDRSFHSKIVMRINDNHSCTPGWHERTIDGRNGIVYRPTQKEAGFRLLLPGGNIEIIALVSASTQLCGGRLNTGLKCGDKSLGILSLDSEQWVIGRFVFENAPKGPATFKWIVENPFVPHKLLKNGDFREMGVYVAGIRVRKITEKGD